MIGLRDLDYVRVTPWLDKFNRGGQESINLKHYSAHHSINYNRSLIPITYIFIWLTIYKPSIK